ncbi:hypothetical protein J7J59_06320 [Candidatus Aerophobetes bacterium]|nr:hypothetical protein [Candidatus Aerophobetes bacterium]
MPKEKRLGSRCALFWLPLIKKLPLDMDNLPKIMKERASKASSSGNG